MATHNMATATPVLNEMHALKDLLEHIPQVEQTYVARAGCEVNVLVVLPDDSMSAQKKVYAAAAELIDAFPGIQFDFDLVFRLGRPLRDVVTPSGMLLFSR